MSNKECFICKKKNLTKSEVGLNKKLLSKDMNQFYCLECLAEYLEVEPNILLEKIMEFKEQGCTMFQ